MTVEFIFFTSTLILLLLFSSFMKDAYMTVVFGVLFTILFVTYFHHRDTILYTEYLNKKVARMPTPVESSPADAADMDALFSMFQMPPVHVYPASSHPNPSKSHAVVEEIPDDEEKPKESSE